MWTRSFWLAQIERLWKKRNVLWLMGVRRAGKTTLAQSLGEVEYLDCELPRVRRFLDDPEAALESVRGKRIVLDEIHRLAEPSQLLKIAADHYPSVHVLATGSSTLGASARFRDTLAGRKQELWLTPATVADLADFGDVPLEQRLLRGGLPPFLLAKQSPERDFQDWMDAYWAKDVLELFRLERRASFLRFFELLMAQSGGIFEATSFAGPCEVSRTTIANYLGVLEATFAVHVLRPFSRRRSKEVVAAPKVYGFDTGFVAYFRGVEAIRPDDGGWLWEHFVLNELHAHLQTRAIHYWRTKHGTEVDFVIARRGRPPIAIECKWSTNQLDTAGLRAFRLAYPDGPSYVVAKDVQRASVRRVDGIEIRIVSLPSLVDELAQEGLP